MSPLKSGQDHSSHLEQQKKCTNRWVPSTRHWLASGECKITLQVIHNVMLAVSCSATCLHFVLACCFKQKERCRLFVQFHSHFGLSQNNLWTASLLFASPPSLSDHSLVLKHTWELDFPPFPCWLTLPGLDQKCIFRSMAHHSTETDAVNKKWQPCQTENPTRVDHPGCVLEKNASPRHWWPPSFLKEHNPTSQISGQVQILSEWQEETWSHRQVNHIASWSNASHFKPQREHRTHVFIYWILSPTTEWHPPVEHGAQCWTGCKTKLLWLTLAGYCRVQCVCWLWRLTMHDNKPKSSISSWNVRRHTANGCQTKQRFCRRAGKSF